MTSYSSFPQHQLITESWRRHLAEDDQPNPEELAQAGQDALEELGEEGVLAAVADLSPEIQAKIDEAAEAMVAELDTQLNETPEPSSLEPTWVQRGHAPHPSSSRGEAAAAAKEASRESIMTGAWIGMIGGPLAALVMASKGLLGATTTGGAAMGMLGGGIAGFHGGMLAGAMVAAVVLKVQQKLGDPDLTSTIVTKPVGKPDAWEDEI